MLRRSLQSLIVWLRPELSIDFFYGPETRSKSQNEVFDPSSLYRGVQRQRDEPCWSVALEGLLPELRTYQQQAVFWMVQRETADPAVEEVVRKRHPLWVLVESLDKEKSFYYNVFNGMVSREPRDCCSYVRGGILADEMGLGKTVEVLACILANRHEGPAMWEPAVEKLQHRLDDRKNERVECICGDDDAGGMMVQCDHCHVWQHTSCVGYSPPKKKKTRKSKEADEDDNAFACDGCFEVIASTEVEGVCGATLIVCPTAILKQWQEEIVRHTKLDAVKVLVYEGVRRGCITLGEKNSCLRKVGAHDLAAADVVITTYDVLQADLCHDIEEENQQTLRFEKKYHVIATPLTRLKWWRICLDEAQMVESSTAKATEMAMRLHAENKWCVSGTPIQRGLDDLYGLLRFLQAEPFDNHTWWQQAIKHPYEEGKMGAVDFVHFFFREIMWRSMKIDVIDQLDIPPQEERITWLKFSGVENHFYRQQHEQCVKRAREVIEKYSLGDGRPLNHMDASKLMNPLLRLRQACCHPQVGSSGVRSLQASPLPMDEVLEVLIEKAKTEGEEAQRDLVASLNGLAGLAIIEENIPMAVSIYREALAATEENATNFEVDPLQKVHILHNLEESLRNCKDDALSKIPRTLRDDMLISQCDELRKKYVSGQYANLAAAQQDFYAAHKEIASAQSHDKSSRWSRWWLDAFAWVQSSSQRSDHLLERIKHGLEDVNRAGGRNASSLVLRYHDLNGLKFLLSQELDAIHETRDHVLSRLLEVDGGMQNPNPDYVQRAGQCSQCQPRHTGITCVHCAIDLMFQKYANRLFYLTSRAAELDGIVTAEDAFVSQVRSLVKGNKETETNTGRRKGAAVAAVTHRCSETEMVLKILLAYMKAETNLEEDEIEAAKKHLEYLEALRSEYAAARRLTTAQQLVLTALDELSMSTTRLCLQGAKAADGNPFGDEGYEIAIRNAELTNEKFVAVENLSRVKRQLRYLKGLRNKKDEGHNSLEGEICPVCHDGIESGAMVLPCGHLLCGKCLNLIVNRQKAPANGADFKRIACPTCRQQTYVSNIAYANAEGTSSKIAENLQEEEEDEEKSITVAGSYGTKIEAVVRRILSLKEDDPFVKILVFSTWQEVLDLLEHALKSNKLSWVRLKQRRQMGSSILEFKKENVQVMLLPIQHGANGLNLIEAQHVILVEPLLNPAVEAQAINRVHRIGQRLKTLVHRFILLVLLLNRGSCDYRPTLAYRFLLATEMGAKFQPLPRFYWTKEQIAAIRDLCRDDDLYVKTKYGRKLRPPPRPRLSREQERFVRADPQAGLDRISGQWVALQHQLGKKPYTAEEQEGNYVGPILGHKQYRRELHLHRGQKQWNVHAVGDKFLVYETLPPATDTGDDPPVLCGRDKFVIGRPLSVTMDNRATNVSSSWNSFPVWSLPEEGKEGTIALPGNYMVPSSKVALPGLVPGKGALVFDALYETVKEGGASWSSEMVEKLDRLKRGITHPHQVCVVLKKIKHDASLSLKLFTWAKTIPGFKHDLVNYSTMIMILGDDGNYLMAEALFVEIQELGLRLDTFAVNNMIRCYTRVNRIQEALDLYRKMPYFGCHPDNCTFGLLIDWCGKFGSRKELQRIFLDLRASPRNADAQTFNTMIHNFCKQRDFANAREAANQMKAWGIPFSSATYAILIHMYAKARDSKAAAELYADYLRSGLEPNLIVYNNVILSYGSSGFPGHAQNILGDIRKAGLAPDRFTYCTLISSWARAGAMLQARRWFNKACKTKAGPSIEMCNALIDGYLKAREVEPAKFILTKVMPERGVEPTLQTYTILLGHYTSSVKVADSRAVREMMKSSSKPAAAAAGRGGGDDHPGVDEFLNEILQGLRAIKELKSYSREFFRKLRMDKPPRWGRWLADALVNHLHCFGYAREAFYVWEGVSSTELYPRGIWEDWQGAWFIWLQDMSSGTAMVALTSGLIVSRRKLARGFERPERVIIVCGYASDKSKEVTHAVNRTLVALDSPFEPFISMGRFMCEGNLFRDWLWEKQVAIELTMDA
ncbi:hypothetical protein SELMODRAFT_444519 [Selaginella moellendorffii]|uniref:RING-type domain-containing protein n=1 Tax=Selaginella moellendorffii TaxID=88036 RepID=D8SAB9_SELML|nr:hypothetical protein SELMODRAFT_444519 [Selaginella moellendorffii]